VARPQSAELRRYSHYDHPSVWYAWKAESAPLSGAGVAVPAAGLLANTANQCPPGMVLHQPSGRPIPVVGGKVARAQTSFSFPGRTFRFRQKFDQFAVAAVPASIFYSPATVGSAAAALS